MISSMSEIEEELDGGIVMDQLRHSEVNHYNDRDYVSYTNFGKSGNDWVNLLSRQKVHLDDPSPRTSHLSPEPGTISDLASPLNRSESMTNLASEHSSTTDVECGVPGGLSFLPPVSTFRNCIQKHSFSLFSTDSDSFLTFLICIPRIVA
ncbi:unnamed protein product [Dicrocoelium dendriticum]|nr:unnamed protein product [Dicrocoelium dendriticum]